MKFKILSLCMAIVTALTCAFGLTACGREVTVKSVEITADGELLITMSDGSKKNLGSIKGDDGEDGVGVTEAYIDDDGNLIIELTTGEKLNCGEVTAPTGRDFYYEEVIENNAVTGYTVAGLANSSQKEIVIPKNYNKKPVVAIKENAFANCGEIVSVKISDSVKTIGKNAFADCGKLKNVSFGSGVSFIDRAAFARCEELSTVNVSDIGAWCGVKFASPSSNPLYFADNFYLNNVLVTDLTFPDTVTSIGSFAFYECDKIVSVNTVNVKTIGESAFYNCVSLESITAGDSLETIGELAFADCESLKTVDFGNSIKEIGNYSFQNCSLITTLSIPSSVETIGESAFTDCKGLRELTLNNGLKTIGDCAFGGCSSLVKFIMPDSVTSLGFGVLMNNEGGWVDESGGINGLSEIRISNSVTEIPDYAFSKCGIKTITIGKSVRKINYSSFYGCGSLESVVLPVSVNHIASYSFYQCDMLNTVYYEGGAENWSGVFIGSNGNNKFREAAVYFYSSEKPAESGNYWRYVNGVPTVWAG